MELLLDPDSSVSSAAPHLLPVAHLSPACLQVELSQEDLSVLLRILLENLGEASSLEHPSQKQDVGVPLQTSGSASTGRPAQIPDLLRPFLLLVWMTFDVFLASADAGPLTVRDDEGESLETLRFAVNVESLALVLYSNDPKQVSEALQNLGSEVLLRSEHSQVLLTLWG